MWDCIITSGTGDQSHGASEEQETGVQGHVTLRLPVTGATLQLPRDSSGSFRFAFANNSEVGVRLMWWDEYVRCERSLSDTMRVGFLHAI